MATRRMRNTTILAKIGVTYGTDVVPTGGANALFVSDVSFTPLQANNVDRAPIRAFMGSAENLVGTAYKEISFTVELAGSGSAGVAPAWGPLLRACGWAETLTATTRVDYLPISTAFEWVDMYVYMDGAHHKLLGCRGTASLDFSAGIVPQAKITLKGIDGGIAAAAPSGVDYSGWKTPQVITDTNTADLLRGCTHSGTGAPALVGGTSLPFSKFTLDMGIDVPFIPLVGAESVEIMDRKITGSVELDLTAANDVAFMADVKANTLASLGLLHGTVANRKVLLFAPNVQLHNPSYTDLNGKLMNSYQLTVTPGATGNDELRIVTSF